jgi:hypothetical protein
MSSERDNDVKKEVGEGNAVTGNHAMEPTQEKVCESELRGSIWEEVDH